MLIHDEEEIREIPLVCADNLYISPNAFLNLSRLFLCFEELTNQNYWSNSIHDKMVDFLLDILFSLRAFSKASIYSVDLIHVSTESLSLSLLGRSKSSLHVFEVGITCASLTCREQYIVASAYCSCKAGFGDFRTRFSSRFASWRCLDE